MVFDKKTPPPNIAFQNVHLIKCVIVNAKKEKFLLKNNSLTQYLKIICKFIICSGK
jgi:hypothetical protein